MNHSSLTAIAVVALMAAGCTSKPVITDAQAVKHIVSIGRDGGLETIEANKPYIQDPGVPEKGLRLKQAYNYVIEGLVEHTDNHNGPVDLVIFIHGGLNTKRESLKRAQKTYTKILSASSGSQYPIFISWRSGPVSTYSAHLTRIRQGEVSPTAKLSSPVYLLTDVASSLVNAPKSWLVSGGHLLETTHERGTHDAYLQNYLEGRHNVLFTGNKDDYQHLGRSLQWLGTSPAKLVTTPFTFTMAKPAWNVMLRRTNTPFYTPDDLANREHDITFGRKHGNGALYQFLLALEALVQEWPAGKPPISITLVGHSMGAIIVNRIIDLKLDLPIRNIVHMASADSINNLLDRVIPYLQREENDVRFYSLSLHPENEDREASLYGLAPSGSLLVWIDNMFTTPETVLDRRSGRWENMERALPLIETRAREKMFFKIYGLNNCGAEEADGVISEPQEHGDFDNLPYWLEETWWKPAPGTPAAACGKLVRRATRQSTCPPCRSG